MTMPDTQSFLGRANAIGEDRPKLPWVKLGEVGDEVDLDVTDKGMAPDYEYNPNPEAPKVQKTWPNGDPMFFMVITGTLRAPTTVGNGTKSGRTAQPGEEVNLAIKGKRLTAAVSKAVITDNGLRDIPTSGRLWIKFTGWETGKQGEAKTYTAKYKPAALDTSGFLGADAGSGLRAPAGKAPAQDTAPPF